MQPDLDPGPGDPGVGGEEVLRQQEPELLRTGDAALLGQDVHRVLLAVRGDDVRVVSGLVILGAVEGEETEHLHLLDGEDGADLGHVEQLHSGLSIRTIRNDKLIT